jgi:hypothetical protein
MRDDELIHLEEMIMVTTLPVEKLAKPMSSFAEHTIDGYLELVSPVHNNVRRNRFVDRPEPVSDGFRV